MADYKGKVNTFGGRSVNANVLKTDAYFGYPKPLNLIIRDNVLPDSVMYPFWAAYFNMARYNMYSTLVHIAALTGLSDGENMENRMDMMRVLNDSVDPEVELSLRKLLYKHFPFIVWTCIADGGEGDINGEVEDIIVPIKDLRECLKTMSFTLNNYRNHYSHTRNVETRPENVIVKSRKSERRTGLYLKKLNTVSTRRVKERFSDKDNSVQAGMVDEQSFKFITEGKIKYQKKLENGRPLLDRNGRPVREAKDNPDYFLNPLVLDPNGTLRDGTNPEKLSTVGKIQLVCLFLEKKYITEFLTQSKFLDAFKDDAKEPKLSDRRLILEVMSDLRTRMPQKKMDSTRDDIQVALDMLNELKKCPQELFDLLGPEDRASFSVMSSTGDPVLLRRSSDRFTQLALQWFDVNRAFSRIRFQVNSGVFRYLFNESKTCLDGKTRLRVLQEPLNGFGRLQEVEETRDSHRDGKDGPWAGYEIKGFDEAARNDAECLPYINDARTRYLVDCDNIGIRFGEEGEQNGDYIPSIEKKDNRYRVSCKPAQCSMSIYELQAMLFLHLLTPGKEGEIAPVERIIIDKVDSYRRLFSDIRDGKLVPSGMDEAVLNARLAADYGIGLQTIPDKLKDYLLGRVNEGAGFKAYRKRLIDTLKEETEYRLEKLNENLKEMRSEMNKPGKPGFVQIRPGALASFLAKDIVLFQEGNADQKMTGLNFSVMQGTIATFGSREGATADDLKTIFRAAGLMTSNGMCGTHPFLATAMNSGVNNTVALYSEYLKARKAYLSGAIPDTAPFLHADRMKWAVRDESYYREYAGRCLDRPVMLPRRLFESAIRERLLSLNNIGLKEEIINAGEHCNSAYMIGSYFYNVKDDSPQIFHGACDGDMVHTYGHRFFQVVRKNLRVAEGILAGLKRDSANSHKTYIDGLSEAIVWAKLNPLPEPTAPRRGPKPKEQSREEIAAKIKRAFNEYTATEKTLRRYVVQDELLFLAAMSSIRDMLGVKGKEWKLGSVGPQSESVLDTILPVVWTRARFDIVKRAGKKQDYRVISKEKVKFIIEQRDVRLKDYGDVYRLLADERLSSLLKYHKGEVVLASDLKSELEAYDQRRVGVFKDIMEYEEKITKGVTDRQLCEAMPQVNASDIDFKVMQQFDTENDELTKTELKTIRNAFCHNSYPEKDVEAFHSKETRQLHGATVPGTANEVSDRAKDISTRTRSK